MIDTSTVREQFQRFSRQWDDSSLLTDYVDLLRRDPLATAVRFRDRLGLSDPRKRARL